jgi:hypothetical protein
MTTIIGSVGRNGRNNRTDVTLVQQLLNADLPPGMARLAADGYFGPKTFAAVAGFQRRRGLAPSGQLSPGAPTWQVLTREPGANPPLNIPAPAAPGAWPANFTFEQFWAFTEPLDGGFPADCMFMVKDLHVATGMGTTFSGKAKRASGLAMALKLEWVSKYDPSTRCSEMRKLCIASLSWSGNEFRFRDFCRACRAKDGLRPRRNADSKAPKALTGVARMRSSA